MSINYSIFDLIGPIMVGPSSSHTAGAARLARLARNIFGKTPERCTISLYGSFAGTYLGHGTHFALAAGLMGWAPDDERIPHSLRSAGNLGFEYEFIPMPPDDIERHPNTVALLMQDGQGRQINVVGASLGGGVVTISEIDGFKVHLDGSQHTVLVRHQDRIGIIAQITQVFALNSINISTMSVARTAKGASALMTFETDQMVGDGVRLELAALRSVDSIAYVSPIGGI